MIDSNTAIELIRRNGGFKPNRRDTLYYRNFCIVFSENGEDVSVDMEIKDEEGNVVGQRKSFEVTQYVYNCQILDDNDAALINQAVQNIRLNKGFKDPLANTHKHAKVVLLPIYKK